VKKTGAYLILLAIAGLCLIYFVRPFQDKSKTNVCRIGAIVFLTGPQAATGTEVKNAFEIAKGEVNAKGGIHGRLLEILYEDSKDNPIEAITAFNRLLLEDVPIVITTGDVVSLKLAPIAAAKHIPLVTTVAAGPDITKQGKSVFQVFIPAIRQAKTVADYAFKNLHLKKVAILFINNEFGTTTSNTFKEIFEGQGGQVLCEDTFEISDRDVRSQIVKLKEQHPEAIYVSGFGPAYPAAFKQLKELGFTGVILTDSGMDVPWYRAQMGSACDGVYFTSTAFDDKANLIAVSFKDKYQSRFHSEPSFCAAFAYDTLNLVASAISKSDSSHENFCTELGGLKQDGVVGRISFNNGRSLDFPLIVRKTEYAK
jgi:branched-chain amino acid transport system substrate-binding protein